MGNRRLYQHHGHLEPAVLELFAEVAIGAAGAPTLTRGRGIASIARSGAGDYLVTLEDKWERLLDFKAVELNSSAQDLNFQLKAQAVKASGTLSFFSNTAGAATDPANGSVLYLSIKLKNSSVGE